MSRTFEKRDVSSTKILHFDTIHSSRPFTSIRNKRCPNTDPCGTPELVFPIQIFDHLKQLFADDFGDSFGVAKVIHPQNRMTLT